MNGAVAGVLAGRHVLVVEDEYFVAVELAEALRAVGAVVVGPAATTDAALALAAAGHLDAALLDVNLNGTMVWPVADLLMARGVPVVLSSGYEAVPPAYAHLPHYQKPAAVHVLLRAVMRCVAAA